MAQAKDVICGMTVDPADACEESYRGTTYYFCSEGCQAEFHADPEAALHPVAKPVDPMEQARLADLEFTCPMHPEVLQKGPGACPICGMALEPADPLAAMGVEGDPELQDLSRRMWVGAAFSAPLLVLAMVEMLPGMHERLHAWRSVLGWSQLVLSLPVALWAAAPIWRLFAASLRNHSANMFTLIGLGVGAAYLASLVGLLVPSALPTGGALYFEAGSVILVLVLVGQVLEHRARARTGSALRALLELTPPVATRIGGDGSDQEIAVSELKPGDRVRVRPGDRLPVDGVVAEGEPWIDESALTGESVPVARAPGAPVSAGTVNGARAFILETKSVGRDTVLARIVQTVAEAQRSKPPIQGLADRVASYFVPAVLAIGVLAAAAWLVFGPEPRLAFALTAAVGVLIIACPCALGLATPMSVMVATGRAAQLGVLLRSAAAFEALARVDTVVVDKTGTLTEGSPKLLSIHAAPGTGSEGEALSIAAAVERGSEHPLARAIVEAALEAKTPSQGAVEAFEAKVGLGAEARVGGRVVRVGRVEFLEIPVAEKEAAETAAQAQRERGSTSVHLAVDGRWRATFEIADPLRSTTERTLERLRAEGLRVVLLSGDHPRTVEALARRLGISEFHAGVSPLEKSQRVASLQKEGRRVAMVGDGINDAPALAQADVGIAMGTGTGVAIQTAGIALIGGDLSALHRAFGLSRAAMRNIRQNLFFAFAYNAAGIPLAAGVLYPWWGELLNPMVAGAAMSFSSVSVIANALRLSRWGRDARSGSMPTVPPGHAAPLPEDLR